MNKANRNAEIPVGPLVRKKHTTAYDDKIEGLGRTSFLSDGLNLIIQRIRPYQCNQPVQSSRAASMNRIPSSRQLKKVKFLAPASS